MTLPPSARSSSPLSRIPLPPVHGGEALARAAALERREDGRARLIAASEELRRRAVNSLHGQDLVLGDALRQQLETVIDAATPAFEEESLARLAAMRVTLAGLQGDAFAMVFQLPHLHDLAIDIKGMGGTFGYHLLTDLAKSLEDLLARVELPTAGECRLIVVHIDAMHMLLARRIRGQGGDLERQLLINLGHAADKVSSEDSAH